QWLIRLPSSLFSRRASSNDEPCPRSCLLNCGSAFTGIELKSPSSNTIIVQSNLISCRTGRYRVTPRFSIDDPDRQYFHRLVFFEIDNLMGPRRLCIRSESDFPKLEFKFHGFFAKNLIHNSCAGRDDEDEILIV